MATNSAYATYTEVIDLQTTADRQSIIGIHTPVGASPYNRLKGFFTQFRKYKYNGIKSLVMVPAAQLPVDPLGLTGVVGTTDLMDPRDTLNPILFHGAHGENLDQILNTIYSSGSYVGTGNNPINDNGQNVSPSAEEYSVSIGVDYASYYSKLTDSSWRKFGIQSGVKLSGLKPLVHTVVQNMPTLPSLVPDTGASALQQMVYRNNGMFLPHPVANDIPVSIGSIPDNLPNGAIPIGERQTVFERDDTGSNLEYVYKQQFTNRMTTLGWLPTTTIQNPVDGDDFYANITILPKCFMGVLVLPPAYNVEQFFRMVITHSFSFKDFTSSLGAMDVLSADMPSKTVESIPYSNWIDYGESKDIDKGATIDTIGGKSTVISDGVM